jgi:hypothetical protein
MKLIINYILIISFLFSTEPYFGERQDWGILENEDINEASGLVASSKNENIFWTHNDSGGESCIFAINQNGAHLGKYCLENVIARDWEDIAISPNVSGNDYYIYIGDIGDNNSQNDIKYIHRIIEPTVSENQSPIIENINNVETFSYDYPNGNRDSETLMVDPNTLNIYIVSKRENETSLYLLPFPQSTETINIATYLGNFDMYPNQNQEENQLNWITAGDISMDGKEILIKSYIHIIHYARNYETSIIESLQSPTEVEYIMEPQGEAVAWHPNGFGYYTTSEEIFGIQAKLYFYPRIVGCTNEIAINFNPYAIDDDESCDYGFQLGDVNQDNLINVIDIVLVVTKVLNNEFYELGDMNEDCLLDILDIVLLVNFILGE